MWILRAVRIEDLDALHDLVKSATRGLTTLQLGREQLLDRIENSQFAFTRSSPSPRGEPYVLVLVNSETNEIIGTSTIYAKTGGHQPFYAYRIDETHHHSEQLGVNLTRRSLVLTRIHDGPTEIGSLFLRGKFRGTGFGRWISLARFALMAMRPERFGDRVIAEMRGRADNDGRVPFFEAVAGKFIPVEFAIADALSTVSKQFIEDLMPNTPIYLDFLSEQVRQEIGQVHRETEPALRMLEKEGFKKTEFVDIFDAGPLVSCETMQIGAVQRTRKCTVEKIVDEVGEEPPNAILCSSSGAFTSVLSLIELNGPNVIVARSAAESLGVDVGSFCYVLGLS